jgi:hypothetical protein
MAVVKESANIRHHPRTSYVTASGITLEVIGFRVTSMERFSYATYRDIKF